MVTCSFSCVPDAIADPGAVGEVDWGLTVDRLNVDKLMVDRFINFMKYQWLVVGKETSKPPAFDLM